MAESAGWFPVPNAILEWLGALSGVELAVALVYFRYQNMPGGIAYPGAGRVAQIIGHKNVRYVRRTIKKLESRGLIATIPGKYGGKISARRRIAVPPVVNLTTGADLTIAPMVNMVPTPMVKNATTPVVKLTTQERAIELEQNKKNTKTTTTTVDVAADGFSNSGKNSDSHRVAGAAEALRIFGIRGSKRKEILSIAGICAGVIESVEKDLRDENPDAGTGLLIEMILEEAPELIRIYRWD